MAWDQRFYGAGPQAADHAPRRRKIHREIAGSLARIATLPRTVDLSEAAFSIG
jgi:hypothetical protein